MAQLTTRQQAVRSGRVQPVKVAVYGLQVARECEDWPEKGQRDLRWVGPEAAAEMVGEGLAAQILAFGRAHRPPVDDAPTAIAV